MECIIFVGIQATGKSTFYREHFFRTHMRINLDMLRTRHRETIIFNACLEAKQPFVVDNTNPTLAERAHYIEPARTAGFRIVGYYFQSRVEDALKRNVQRPGSERIPEAGIYGTSGKLQLPAYIEGFDTLYHVHIKDKFIVETWQDE